MRYSNNFERDFKWYLSVRNKFNFSGKDEVVVYDKNGINGKAAFYKFDSEGKMVATKHPTLLGVLLKTKASVNLHIKTYAEDRASGVLPKIDFIQMCEEFKSPKWFFEAVENQKGKYYK